MWPFRGLMIFFKVGCWPGVSSFRLDRWVKLDYQGEKEGVRTKTKFPRESTFDALLFSLSTYSLHNHFLESPWCTYYERNFFKLGWCAKKRRILIDFLNGTNVAIQTHGKRAHEVQSKQKRAAACGNPLIVSAHLYCARNSHATSCIERPR